MNKSKIYLFSILFLMGIGLLFVHTTGLLSTVQQPTSQSSYLDEGNITLNGVFYNHHITLFAPSSNSIGDNGGSGTWSKSFYISKVYTSGIWIPTIVKLKIFHSATYKLHTSQDAVWYQIYDSDSGKLWQTSGNVLTNYNEYLAPEVTAYKGISQNSNLYIGIDKSQIMSFRVGCNAVYTCYNVDARPKASFNVPPIIITTQKQLERTKYATTGYWKSTNPYIKGWHYKYLSHIGGQLITPGYLLYDDDAWAYDLMWTTYWYQNIFSDYDINPIVTIAFNVPDSDHDGVDDLNDISPHDPQITTIVQAKNSLTLLTSQLKSKQIALNIATSKLNTVNSQLNAKLKVITKLNTNILVLNAQLTNKEMQYQSLELQINKLQNMSNQLNSLILQSNKITQNISNNLAMAHGIIVNMDTKLTNMENIVKTSSLSQKNKNNMITTISSIRTNNQQLLVIIQQTQSLLTQQKSLQLHILNHTYIKSE